GHWAGQVDLAFDPVVDRLDGSDRALVSVSVDEAEQQLSVHVSGVEIGERVDVAAFPKGYAVREEVVRPRHARLQESKWKVGKSLGDAAQDHRRARGLVSAATEAVEHVIGYRAAAPRCEASSDAMERDGDPSAHTGLPHDVVVVRTVDAEVVNSLG